MKSLLILFFTLFSFLAVGQDLTEVQKQQLDVNYLINGGFENGKSGWSTYNDGASATPVDGIGGTANITLTTTTTLPHDGKVSGVLTKDAVNRQGQGIKRDFTIPDVAKGKVVRFKFSYEITSGTYASSDLSVWIYDVTNSRLIQPSAHTIESTTLKETKFVEWQSSIDSNSYRLIVHLTSTSASAYTLKFDTFSIGLTPKIYGSVATDPVAFTPIITGGASYTNEGSFCHREGKFLICNGTGVITTPSATAFTVQLPFGLKIDPTSSPTTTDTFSLNGHLYGINGTASSVYPTTGNGPWQPFANIADNDSLVYFARSVSGSMFLKAPANDLFTSGSRFRFQFKAPIAGWSSSQQLSNDTDTRIVFAKYATNSAKTSTSSLPFDYETKIEDTHNAVTTGSAWKFRAPVSGFYRISAGFVASSAPAVNNLYLYKNGSAVPSGGTFAKQVSTNIVEKATNTISLFAGDYIDLRNGSGSTATLASDSGVNSIEIERISGPSQIASSEFVGAKYTSSSGQSIPSAVRTIVDFATKEYDTHNSVTTGAFWKFTAPISGTYRVSYSSAFTSASWVNGNLVLPELRKGGSIIHGYDIVIQSSFTNSYTVFPLVTTVRLLAGEYIDATLYQNTGSSKALVNSSLANHIEIERIGSY